MLHEDRLQCNFINTNSRSLRPKLPNFIETFYELDCTFAFITETWLTDGERLDLELEGLLLGSGLDLFSQNRPAGNAGFSHGGVAIVTRDLSTKFKKLDFPNPEGFEVLVVVGNIAKVERKVALVTIYIPPNYSVLRSRHCFQHVNDRIHDIKRKFKDTMIFIGGDFNQWDITEALADFPDIIEVETPPTRNNRRIDRVFTNHSAGVVDFTCLAPLRAENAAGDHISSSDHKIQFVATVLEKRAAVEWEEFTIRPFNDKAAEGFIDEIEKQDWSAVLNAAGSNKKAGEYQAIIDDLIDRHFPKKTIKRKSDDLPWLNETAKKKIARKKAVYKDEAKSERWKALRDDLDQYLAKRRDKFLSKQRDNLLGPDADKHFFKNVSAYKSFDKPRSFDVRDLRPGAPDQDVADEVAGYFNRISCEFQPLQPQEIPSTYHRDLPPLTPAMVESRLKKCKKPSSMVAGDLFPKLVNPCARAISVPLSDIYNSILSTYVWPISWKREYVSTIPKKKLPSDFSDLRNISCTLLVSKVFEAYVLQCAMEEITLKKNQYGGVKGCSTSHMLVDIIQEICTNAEDYRSATVITAIDYAKAFNRVSYQHCLKAFEKKNASSPILRLLATFLTNRTMSVRVGSAWSEPLDVNGGCPQGSILGVFLFNVTTEDLEEEFEDFEKRRVPDTGDLPPAPLPVAPGAARASTSAGEPPTRPVTSSPVRRSSPSFPLSPIGGGAFRMAGARRVRLELGVRNAPSPFIQPPAETKIGTQVLVNKRVRVFKYVDDNITCEKLNFGNVVVQDSSEYGQCKIRQAVSSQNAFFSITGAAKKKGMKVNESKTNLLCVSDSLNFKSLAYFNGSNNERIECSRSIKILGFYLTDRTGVSMHVEEIAKNMRRKYWVLYHLRRLGFTESELVRVYKMNILPAADYCCAAYHSLLSDLQDQALERAQIGALRCIFGYGLSARKLREKAGLSTLRARRIELVDKFAEKCLLSDRFKEWFPLRQGRCSSRKTEKYLEEFAKCERLKNSPLFYMRRRLNGKEGKVYGERNREYRE